MVYTPTLVHRDAQLQNLLNTSLAEVVIWYLS